VYLDEDLLNSLLMLLVTELTARLTLLANDEAARENAVLAALNPLLTATGVLLNPSLTAIGVLLMPSLTPL
jgi:hypothetical protein